MQLASSVETRFSGQVDAVKIEPAKTSGSFEVYLDDELVYSKLAKGRLPHPDEVEQLLMKRIF